MVVPVMNPKSYIWTICSLGCGLLLVVFGLILSFLPANVETNVLLYEHRQLFDDWTTQPFTDILVVDANFGCPDEYEPLFYKVWNGTKEFCFSMAPNNVMKLVETVEDQVCDGEIIE